MTHEEYLEAKKLQRHYNEIVCEYERQIDRKYELKKAQAFKSKFSKGTLITFTGGSHTKQLKRESQYPVVSISKPYNYICWMITVKNENGSYTRIPEYCFREIRETNSQLKKEFDESTNN